VNTTARRLAGLLVVGALTACSGGSDGSAGGTTEEAGVLQAPTTTAVPVTAEPVDDRSWPVPDWEVVDPAAAGLDAAALEQMAATAERAGSECLVVTKDGALVGEWYWDGFDAETEREVFSVTKSITATLVGIAQDRGLLDIDDRASDYIDEWKGTPSEGVTIRNLVSNDSGRYHDFDTDYVQMAGRAPDKTAFSIGLSQQVEPGTTWVYNNAAIQTLDAVLEEATGMPTGEFASEALFEPLGMGTTINTDAAGNTLTFMGAQASCRDLARFGLLHLRDGSWGEEQVVSSEWVDEATRPSQEINPAYGFLWWLNRAGDVGVGTGDDAREGSIAGSADSSSYAALGLFNQVVGVFPSSGLVVTRLGADKGEDGSSFGLGEVAAGLRAALGEEPAQAEVQTG
jgi:CubicO group peptidase (beta-lactamase class C family)